MFNYKALLLVLLISAFTIALVFIGHWTNGVVIVDSLSLSVNKQLLYQSTTLLAAIVLMLVLRRVKRSTFDEYFRIGHISAAIKPEPWVGIQPKATENWYHFGRNFAVIISSVTALVIYFQLLKGNDLSAGKMVRILPFSMLFALTNSFVEESITRLGVVVALKNVLNDRQIALVSAVVFGTVHYWGNPGGIAGVLVAGFLGWLLAKSILETKGMFWAWLIHFLQDVIIFSALLSIN